MIPGESTVVSRLRAAGCVFAEDEAALLIGAAGSAGELADLVARRVGGEPLEQLLGWVEFCGLRIAVEPGVFVPRRRTELLVREARGGRVVVDLCCGSGAVGAALGADVELYAVDIEPAAVRCARRNLPHAHVYEGDLFAPLPGDLRGRVDVLVANVPYVPTAEIPLLPPEARLHEPRRALDGGADGLDVARRVAGGALDWLAPGGRVLVETSTAQAPIAVDVMARNGLTPAVTTDDELGATVVSGRAPGR
jgi:release factor glutamine methyltransferase